MQVRISSEPGDEQLRLLGVLMRGMTYDGERWRLATVGEWLPEGPHLPQQQQVKQLQQICRELFELFDGTVASEPARNPSQRTKPSCLELLLSLKSGHFSQSCLSPLLPSSGKARKSRTPWRRTPAS